MNAKKTIIIIIGIIIALIIIINVYSALTSPTATIDNLQVEKEGKIIEIEPKDTSSDVDDSSSDDSSDYEDDGYELAKSNRGKYDYDGDGFLNDYEFQKFCEGEGQEYLLDY